MCEREGECVSVCDVNKIIIMMEVPAPPSILSSPLRLFHVFIVVYLHKTVTCSNYQLNHDPAITPLLDHIRDA